MHCVKWLDSTTLCWKLVPVNKVFTNTFFQHDILHGCTTWPSVILLSVASKTLQHLITVSVGEQETTITIQLLRGGAELNNCTIRVIEAVKAGSQYDAGTASIASVESITRKFFPKVVKFYSIAEFYILTFWLVGRWLTLATECWNSNQVSPQCLQCYVGLSIIIVNHRYFNAKRDGKL